MRNQLPPKKPAMASPVPPPQTSSLKPQASLLLLILSSSLTACMVGPNFHNPKVTLNSDFSESSTTESRTATTAQPPAQWWHSFNDPVLDHLIEQALQNNYDIQIAATRIREARAQRNITAGNLFPEINATAGYNKARGSKNVNLPLGGNSSSNASNPSSGKSQKEQTLAGGNSQGSSAQNFSHAPPPLSPLGAGGLPGVTTSLYQAGFDANWELDIFGGHRRDLEAAAADLAAADENRRLVTVTLLAEVARNYLEFRAAQERLDVARQNLAAQNEILELTRSRRKQGFVTDLDVTRASGEVSLTAASVPPLQAQTRRSLHALAALLATTTPKLAQQLNTPAPVPILPPQVPVGLPSDLLLRRPDIRRSLLQIKAANARIGNATADLFPKFALTGSVGLDASKLSNLLNWDSRYFLISPTVSWPIFDAGRIVSNISLQKANTAESVLTYKKTILTALQEVEDALINYDQEQLRNHSLADALAQNQQSLTIARMQYKQGLINFLDVLEAQRSVLATQDTLAQSKSLMATNLVALYKALGGGWQIENPPP